MYERGIKDKGKKEGIEGEGRKEGRGWEVGEGELKFSVEYMIRIMGVQCFQYVFHSCEARV